MQRADAGIASPGEDEPPGAAHTNHLIVDKVRRHADQAEIPPLSADDLVARREGNQVGKPLYGQNGSVANERGNRFP